MPNMFPALLVSGVETTARTPASISTFCEDCPAKISLLLTSSTITRSADRIAAAHAGSIVTHIFKETQEGLFESALSGYRERARI